jgi:hypothetical protein
MERYGSSVSAVAEAGIKFRCGVVYKYQTSNMYNTITQELTATLYNSTFQLVFLAKRTEP